MIQYIAEISKRSSIKVAPGVEGMPIDYGRIKVPKTLPLERQAIKDWLISVLPEYSPGYSISITKGGYLTSPIVLEFLI